MRLPSALALLLALASLSSAARAQAPPLTWERVGDIPPDADALAFDRGGTLYAGHSVEIYRLDLSGGFPGVWELRNDDTRGSALLGLGPDTLIASTSEVTKRSINGGETWGPESDYGFIHTFSLHEAVPGSPIAGTLFVGGVFAASEDRGATWEERSPIPGFGSTPYAFASLPSGRLIAGGRWGAAYTDDGGQSWTISDLWAEVRILIEALTVTGSPEGGARVIAVGVDSAFPSVRAYYSDDGGATWLPEDGYPLPEPTGDVGAGNVAGVWPTGGSGAVTVLGRGTVYGTEDGGETWSAIGQVPDVDQNRFVKASAPGPDGRLYVSLNQVGPADEWVWRSNETVVVPVASEAAPASGEGLRLRVRPNPSSPDGGVQVEVVLARPGSVSAVVYDTLGRRVGATEAGVLGAGTHTLMLPVGPLASGVYGVRITVQETGGTMQHATQRFTVVE